MRVTLQLLPSFAAWNPAHKEVGGVKLTTDATGKWQTALQRTDELYYPGTWVWRVIEDYDGLGTAGIPKFYNTYYIAPSGPGPFTVDMILAPTPGTIAPAPPSITALAAGSGIIISSPGGPVPVISADGSAPVYANVNATPYTISHVVGASEDIVRFDCSGGALTCTLPDATTIQGRRITIKRIDSSTNLLNLTTVAGQTIDGLASPHAVGNVNLYSTGSNWETY